MPSSRLVVLMVVVGVPFLLLDAPWKWATLWRYRQKFIDGYKLTILISVCALALSIVFGLLSALAGRSRLLVLRYVNRVYIDLVRGTPLLVQILVLFYVTANAVGIDDRNVCGVLILSFSYGAYLSEIIRAGIESVGKSQLESASAIGLTDGADVPVRDLSAGDPANPAVAGRPVGLARQGQCAAFDDLRLGVHPASEGNGHQHCERAGLLPGAGGGISRAHAAGRLADSPVGGGREVRDVTKGERMKIGVCRTTCKRVIFPARSVGNVRGSVTLRPLGALFVSVPLVPMDASRQNSPSRKSRFRSQSGAAYRPAAPAEGSVPETDEEAPVYAEEEVYAEDAPAEAETMDPLAAEPLAEESYAAESFPPGGVLRGRNLPGGDSLPEEDNLPAGLRCD